MSTRRKAIVYNKFMLQTPVAEESIYLPETFVRITVEQYHKMIHAGVFAENDAIELLEGQIIHKMAKNRPHTIATHLIRRAFERIIPDGYYVDAQEPLTLVDSEPEPDVLIVRGQLADYEHQPTANDVPLVVEVAAATLMRDQGWKRKLYARSGIPVYWVVNLPDQQIEVYSQPVSGSTAPTYRQKMTFALDDEVPVEVDGSMIMQLSVKSLLHG